MNLNSNWYDYGARMYDPALGRWNTVDPMAAERLWVSPYNYAQNDPINRIDPNGALDDEWQYNIESNEMSRTSDLGGEDVQFVNIVDNNQEVLGSATIEGSRVYVDEYEINGSEGMVSISNAPTNAKQLTFGNTGNLLSNNSPFSMDAKHSLMTSSIHQGQKDFTFETLSFVGDAMDKVGTGVTAVGYGAVMFPGGQAIGGGLITLGSGMSKVGSGINAFLDIKEGNYFQAGISLGTMGTGRKIRKSLNKLENAGKLGSQGKTILGTGADLKLKLLDEVTKATIEEQ